MAVLLALPLAAGAVGPQNVVYGTKGNDVIRGNQAGPGKPAQTIYGLGGDDRIWGGKGADSIYGGRGKDRLHDFHAGNDSINGGPGFDKCVVDSKDAADAVSCEKVVVKAKQGTK